MDYMGEHIIDLDILQSDTLFKHPERICVYGSSGSGKTSFVVDLVKKYQDSFHKIILCGQGNKLLDFKETSKKTKLHRPKSSSDEIFNPFNEFKIHELKKYKRQVLLIYDDLQEVIFNSPIISKIFSQGRHRGFSVILLLQTYFPGGSGGKTLMPQIRANCTIQIFLKGSSYSEIGVVASKLTHGKSDREYFLSLFKDLVADARYGYLAVLMNPSDPRLSYVNNLLNENDFPFMTVHIKS